MISLISNIPVFWECTSSYDTDRKRMQINVNPFRMEENYVILFKNGFEGVVMTILPFLAMICFNARIIYTLTQRRETIGRGIGAKRLPNTEMNLGKVLIAMDIVFLFCNLGRVVVNVWEIFHIEPLRKCLKVNQLYKVLYLICHNIIYI